MSDCVHWYIIPPPDRPPVGVCKYCGARKRHSNTADASVWSARPLIETGRAARDFTWAPVNTITRADLGGAR